MEGPLRQRAGLGESILVIEDAAHLGLLGNGVEETGPLLHGVGEDAITELDANGGWADSEGAVAAAQEIIDLRNAGYFADGAPDEYPSSQNKRPQSLPSRRWRPAQ